MGIENSVGIYTLTKQLPKEELFGLTNQIRRAANSIPINVAEGYGRNNRKEYVQFVGIAYGSCCEVETLLILCDRLYKLDVTREMELTTRVGAMLWKLRESLRTS